MIEHEGNKYGEHSSRKEMILDQKGVVLWFTGLSGSGKTTLGSALEIVLHTHNHYVIQLDGDNLRQGLNRDLGFSAESRKENIRRTAEVAKLLVDNATIVIATLISPYEADRALARSIVGSDRFIEIFVSSPIDVCIKRDPKGLYKKALSGEIPKFTGISDPYEVPQCPDLIVATDVISLDEAVLMVCNYLQSRIGTPFNFFASGPVN